MANHIIGSVVLESWKRQRREFCRILEVASHKSHRRTHKLTDGHSTKPTTSCKFKTICSLLERLDEARSLKLRADGGAASAKPLKRGRAATQTVAYSPIYNAWMESPWTAPLADKPLECLRQSSFRTLSRYEKLRAPRFHLVIRYSVSGALV